METLRQIYWLLSTGFTDFEILRFEILIKVGLETTAQICISSAKGDRLGLNFESILGWWRHHV